MRREIIDPTLPPPNGHYSHAVVFNGAVYVSGVLPMVCKTDAPLSAQFEAVFNTIEQILKSAGTSLDKTVNCQIYVSDLKDWPELNRLYGERFSNCKPARVVVPVKELHFGYKLEVELMAEI